MIRGALGFKGWSARGIGTAIAATVLAGCGDTPTQPADPTPRLSNFGYTVEELNMESCPPAGLEGSTLFRWTVDYDDTDGDVEAPIVMSWSSSFYPSGITKAAVIALPAAAVVQGDGFGGTIAQTQCIRFVNEERVDVTVSILDAEGHQSEIATLRIDKPAGALSPRAGGTPRVEPVLLAP